VGHVLVNTSVTLDGFIAGPNHEMDWIFDNNFLPHEPIAIVDEIIATTGAVMCGRNCYDVGESSSRSETKGLFGGAWTGPEFVLTHRPPPASELEDRGSGRSLTFLTPETITEAVGIGLEASQGKNLFVLGANVVQQCLSEDLVDEMILFVVPLLLGDGITLFGSIAANSQHVGAQFPLRFETRTVTQVGRTLIIRLGKPGAQTRRSSKNAASLGQP
jgi:dihydrofolate reductase